MSIFLHSISILFVLGKNPFHGWLQVISVLTCGRGVLDKSKTLEHVWQDTVGDYESVLNGDLTVYDMYKITKHRAKQAQDTVNDANIIVMNAQAKNKEVLEQSKEMGDIFFRVIFFIA